MALAAFPILVRDTVRSEQPEFPGRPNKKGPPFLGRQPFGTATANSWRAQAQPVKIEVLASSGVVQRLY
jgi:hypothetical protein